MRRRTLLRGIAAAGAGTLVTARANAQGRVQVDLQLGWIGATDQIGEACAKHAGYYDAEGLDVRIHSGAPNIDGIAIVASGRHDVGQVSSTPSLMLAVSRGIPIRCFAVGAQQHPFTYYSLKKNPVRRPEDLVGKRLGTQATGVILLRALFARQKLPEDSVQIVTAGTDMSALLEGHVDAMTTWPTNVRGLRALGDQRVEMRLWDAGVRLYALPYYATVQTLKTKPAVLAKFLRATAKGWEFAHRHREQAVDFVLEEFPGLHRADELEAADVILRYAFGPATRRSGWGAMDAALWQEQIDLFAQLKQFPQREPRVADVMTQQVLDATASVRPKLG